jgi:hypothetical protein
LMAKLSTSRPPLSLLEGGDVNRRLVPTSRLTSRRRRLRTRCVLVDCMRGERQRVAMLADARLPPKAAESNPDKATSSLARMPASDSPLSLLEGGGGGRRLALASRRLLTRCVLVHELAGQEDWRLGGRRRPCRMG